MARRILIKKIDLPPPGNLEDDIDFICRSFGYFSQRDKQDTAGKIFRCLVRAGCGNEDGLTSDEIAEQLDLTRGAIVHHLNSFLSAGLVIRYHNTYRIRCASLQKSLEEIKEDIDRIFYQIMKIAKDIDNNLGNYYR
jgi:DNA-binding MarR family transcriptional regulator